MSLQYDSDHESTMFFRGVTDASATTGQCDLSNDMTYTLTDDYFRIPKGMEMKIKARRAVTAGQATTFNVEFSNDGTNYRTIDTIYVVANTEENTLLEMREPMILRGMIGTERFRVSWVQGTAAAASIVVNFELCNMSKDD